MNIRKGDEAECDHRKEAEKGKDVKPCMGIAEIDIQRLEDGQHGDKSEGNRFENSFDRMAGLEELVAVIGVEGARQQTVQYQKIDRHSGQGGLVDGAGEFEAVFETGRQNATGCDQHEISDDKKSDPVLWRDATANFHICASICHLWRQSTLPFIEGR